MSVYHKRIILVGRACSGKDFMRQKFIKRGYSPSISYTTRPVRDGEVEGLDYFFVNRELFEKAIKEGYFYEYVEFNGWYYGTTVPSFHNDEVFIMTPAGISKIKKNDRKRCFIMYLNPPRNVILERMNDRNMPYDSVKRRMEADDMDFKDFKDFDYEITGM